MTSTELKKSLLSTATTLESVTKTFPHGIDQGIVSLLQQVSEKEIALLAVLFGISAEQTQANIANIITMLQDANTFFAADEALKIASFCRRLASHPIIMAILAKFI